MGCCNNNKGSCQNNHNNANIAGYQVTDAPVESLMDIRDIAALLITMASTGVKNFSFKEAALEQLANAVSKLAAENNYLKKLSAMLSPTTVTRTEDVVTVSFGPGNAYTLLLPIGSEEARVALAAQFNAAAKELCPQNDKIQMRLFDL
jgi:hypothetical protein